MYFHPGARVVLLYNRLLAISNKKNERITIYLYPGEEGVIVSTMCNEVQLGPDHYQIRWDRYPDEGKIVHDSYIRRR